MSKASWGCFAQGFEWTWILTFLGTTTARRLRLVEALGWRCDTAVDLTARDPCDFQSPQRVSQAGPHIGTGAWLMTADSFWFLSVSSVRAADSNIDDHLSDTYVWDCMWLYGMVCGGMGWYESKFATKVGHQLGSCFCIQSFNSFCRIPYTVFNTS